MAWFGRRKDAGRDGGAETGGPGRAPAPGAAGPAGTTFLETAPTPPLGLPAPTAVAPVPGAPMPPAPPVPGGPRPDDTRYLDDTRDARPERLAGTLDDVSRRRRAADQQVTTLEGFEAKLSHQLRTALDDERRDYARELLTRRLAVRARLAEVTSRRDRLYVEEQRRLAAGEQRTYAH